MYYQPLLLTTESAVIQDDQTYVAFAILCGFERELGPDEVVLCVRVADGGFFLARRPLATVENINARQLVVTGVADHYSIRMSILSNPMTYLDLADLAENALEWYEDHPIVFPGWEKRSLKAFLQPFVAFSIVSVVGYVVFSYLSALLELGAVAPVYLIGNIVNICFPINKLIAARLPEEYSHAIGSILGWGISILLWGYAAFPYIISFLERVLGS